MSSGVLVAVVVGPVLAAAVVRRRRANRVRARLLGRRPLPVVPGSGALARWLAPRLAAADLDWPPGDVARWWSAAPVALPAVALAVGPVAAVLAALAVMAVPPVGLRLAGGRRDDRVEQELAGLLEAVARSLRSGASLSAALTEAAAAPGPAAADLGERLAEAGAGAPLAEALARWPLVRPLPGVRLAVGALVLAAEAGGAPARAIDGVASTLRERHEVDREVRALSTQARTSALVVTAAPLVFGVLGLLGDERTAAFLLTTPAGWACLAGGLGLDGLGAWWMARLTAGPPAVAQRPSPVTP